MTDLQKQIGAMTAFKDNMLDFFDELIEQYPQEGDLIVMRFFLSEQIPVETLMERFITFVLPHREAALRKDEKFFLENDNIFGVSPKDKVIHFKRLYEGMNKEDRLMLFEWFKTFIEIADLYLKSSGK